MWQNVQTSSKGMKIIAYHYKHPSIPSSKMHVPFQTSLFLHLSLISFVFLYPLFPLWDAVRENKMFTENEIRNIMFQVLSGLAFVHKHGKGFYFVIFLL